MTFEEDFPNLDVFKHPEAAMIYSDAKYLKPYIMKHCLDKQRVKDAIKAIKEYYYRSKRGVYEKGMLFAIQSIEEDLGL